MRTLKPKNYILSTEKTEEYECSICNYIAEKPYRCLGPCKKIFCRQCVNCIKNIRNQCPYKCSNPFQLTPQKEIAFEYGCPFDPEHCKEPIGSLANFFNHAVVCKYVPEGWKQKQENYLHYRCEKGHQLFYLGQQGLRMLYRWDFYQRVMNSLCDCCKEQGYCRSVCPQCSTKANLVLYCTNCRKPPCTKKTCFYEHKLEKLPNHGSKGKMCDFCGTAVYLYGPYGYQDRQCNFDICEACFANLPDKHEQVPFKMELKVIDHLDYDYEEEKQKKQEQIKAHRPIRRLSEILEEREIQIEPQLMMRPRIISLDRHQEEPYYNRIQGSKQKEKVSCWAKIFCCCFKTTTTSETE